MKVAAILLVNLPHLVLPLILCFSLCCAAPCCTITKRHHPVPYCTALCLISTQCTGLNMGLSGVIAGWIYIRAGPRSRLLQGAFLQQLIVKTRTSLDLFWVSRIMSGKVQWQKCAKVPLHGLTGLTDCSPCIRSHFNQRLKVLSAPCVPVCSRSLCVSSSNVHRLPSASHFNRFNCRDY